MRYYLNKRTGVAASKSWRETCLMAFSEVEGRKDFNRRMNPFDSEVFLRDPDTKRVTALEAETYELLRDPDFTVSEDDPLAVEDVVAVHVFFHQSAGSSSRDCSKSSASRR